MVNGLFLSLNGNTYFAGKSRRFNSLTFLLSLLWFSGTLINSFFSSLTCILMFSSFFVTHPLRQEMINYLHPLLIMNNWIWIQTSDIYNLSGYYRGITTSVLDVYDTFSGVFVLLSPRD